MNSVCLIKPLFFSSNQGVTGLFLKTVNNWHDILNLQTYFR